MSIIYRDGDAEVYGMLEDVMGRYFSVLAALPAGPIIQVRMASDPGGGPGVRWHGHAAFAVIKGIGARERARDAGDFPDLRLFIDADAWSDFDDDERAMLLWHELNHVVPRRDKKSGALLYDSYGRIKIKLRKDDWLLTGFRGAFEVFGEAALEYRALKSTLGSLVRPGPPFVREEVA